VESKIYTIEHLGCANCAAKMESKINALPQVERAAIVFATRQLRVTAQNPDALLGAMQAIVSSIEPEARITAHKPHGTHKDCCGHHDHHDHGCSCGHNHEHHHDHEHAHKHEHEHGGGLWPLILGAALFALGLILDDLGLSLWTVPAGLPVYIAAYLVLGGPILLTAGKNLLRGHVFDENFLMSIATLGAFAIREYPEAVGVMLFFRIGEYFEHRAVERSRSQIMAAVDLRPETVNRIRAGEAEVIPAGEAQIGDLLLVRPGDRIPLDGVVVSGESLLDTAPITGEPVPVRVQPGDSVLSGCINTSGQLTVRVEKVLSESMVTRILQAVENAAAGKPKIDRFITRFSRIYTPVVVAAAVLTAVVPSLIWGNWSYWVYTALSFLVMSCPCALVLSVPLAFFSGIGVGSKQGILFKGGVSIEALAGIRVAAMDKTGTVTKGEFRVQNITGGTEVLRLSASCEQNSTHPIAVSIVRAAREQGLSLQTPEQLEELPGMGIRGVIDGKTVLCGNQRLMAQYGIACQEMNRRAGSWVLVAFEGELIGALQISDTVKPGAREAVCALHRMGIDTVMLTGDTAENARAVAEQCDIGQVHDRLLPEDKLTLLQQLRKDRGATLFVGDGINDAPVLAGADVGAAMGSGADAAIEAADVVYMTSDVAAIPVSIRLARRTRSVAWQNVVFALAVKGIAMALGLAGFASMWVAVFADSGVAMLCVLNSVRLLFEKSN
jgi:Cd2+/Zn2+-exporting ATPase